MRALLPVLLLGVIGGPGLAGAAGDMLAFKVERWVNSPPLTAEALRGKVVLVDFWEYTCINWIRTGPYVRAWHRDYAALGLVVVGVHAPEFEFGKRAENIDRGIRDHGLTYPIAHDELEKRLAEGPVIAAPTITLDGDSDGVALASDGTSYARKFSGWRTHRIVKGAGHNLPQEAPQAFADTVIDVDRYQS